ncbi:hypothetical protein [Sulfurospirillum arsenophilum]|uniref:hypothetical protein n=1 Tax=Sulfurospirillum arsenophilum TaxID=56698 RepID=UPI0005A9BD1F|nr:hypothetical protein [Sulfurospirillum arsenophilum]
MNKQSFDNLTEEEKKAIYIWTNSTLEYRHIKRIFQGNYLDDFLKEYLPTANLLRGLFEKYIDNTDKKKSIFRGDILEDENNEVDDIFFVFKNNHVISQTIELENSILSFSYDIQTAENSIFNSSKNIEQKKAAVIYEICSRKSVYLDISNFSIFKNENEILVQPKLKFRVIDITQHSDYIIHCKLDEV